MKKILIFLLLSLIINCADYEKDENVIILDNKMMIDEFERQVRNDLLEEVAQKFEAMKPMTDTAASFAVYVREMKR